MTKDMLNKIFFAHGISFLREIGSNVYLIKYSEAPEVRQVLKVIDIAQKAKEMSNEKYPEEKVKKLFGIIHENELIWNEKITLTQCEYLVRILENYTLESVEDDIFLYAIRMPYYKTLSTILEESVLVENTIINLGIDICNALRTLHHDGSEEYYQNETVRFGTILHLDIKPDNIFYDEKNGQGTFMLGDFGTAIEKGKTFHPMGTYGYYAQEMHEPDCIPTEMSDIFSLGMVLYRCVCDSEEELKSFWEARCAGEAVEMPKNCSPHLWNVIERSTRRNPEERYQSASELQSVLGMINVNKTVVAEVLREKEESSAVLALAAAILEACVIANSILGSLKKLPNKTEQLDFGIFGTYEGGIKDGNPHGKGKFTYKYGSETKSIVGNWEWVKKKRMKCEGVRILYTGMLCNGEVCGLGRSEIPRIGTYLGITEYGNFQIGTMQWKNGDTYAGQWTQKAGYDCMHGEGTYCYADGTVKSGQWEYAEFVQFFDSEKL